MGCDIHCYIETKRHSEDKWKALPVFSTAYTSVPELVSPYGGRDYELFGWLTGGVVRSNTDTPLCAPKGLPVDVSQEVSDCYMMWGGAYHSASYFTIAELKTALYDTPKKIKVFDDKIKNELRPRIKHFIRVLEIFADSCGWYDDDEVRVVFWFDS